jgi:hypothetical protein
MALHAMTIDPKTGLPRGEKLPASAAAVVSVVCGILLCLGPLSGVPAIVAGLLARKAAREKPESVGGGGMAAAGIALGILNLLLTLIAGLVLAYWLERDASSGNLFTTYRGPSADLARAERAAGLKTRGPRSESLLMTICSGLTFCSKWPPNRSPIESATEA